MQHRLRSLALILTLILALGATLVSASQWAVTASNGKVFLMKYDGGSVSSYVSAELSGSALTGIATWNNYVFVADGASAGDTGFRHLRVGKMTNPSANPTIQWIGSPIALAPQIGNNILKSPGAVTVDANGGVYVLGSRWNDLNNVKHSNYAYVTSASGAWTDASVSIVNLASSSTALADIAATGTGAVIAHQDAASGSAFQTWATVVNGTSAGTGALLDDTGYFPRGIAAGSNGSSYIANYSTEVNPGAGPSDPGVGSISIVGSNLPAIQLGDFRPTDIAYLTAGGFDYLGLVGVTNGGLNQARRYTLGIDGLPILESAVLASLDTSNNHYCTASLDGALFWATNQQANTVTAIDTLTWTVNPANNTASVDGAVGYIAPIVVVVPEPSSVIALLTGGIGLLGLRRRRRSS